MAACGTLASAAGLFESTDAPAVPVKCYFNTGIIVTTIKRSFSSYLFIIFPHKRDYHNTHLILGPIKQKSTALRKVGISVPRLANGCGPDIRASSQ